MSVIAISSASLAISAANSARIAEHDRHQCQAFMPSYEAKAATVEQARYYSHCVEVVYPHPMEGSELMWGKVFVVILIIAFFGGAILGWVHENYDRVFNAVMGAFMLPAAVATAGFVLAGIVIGIKFVVS